MLLELESRIAKSIKNNGIQLYLIANGFNSFRRCRIAYELPLTFLLFPLIQTIFIVLLYAFPNCFRNRLISCILLTASSCGLYYSTIYIELKIFDLHFTLFPVRHHFFFQLVAYRMGGFILATIIFQI